MNEAKRVIDRRLFSSLKAVKNGPGYTIAAHGSTLREKFIVPKGVHIVLLGPPGGYCYKGISEMVLRDPSVQAQIYNGTAGLLFKGNPLYSVHYPAGDCMHDIHLRFPVNEVVGVYPFPFPDHYNVGMHINLKGARKAEKNWVKDTRAAYTVGHNHEETTLRQLILQMGPGMYVGMMCRPAHANDVLSSMISNNARVRQRQRQHIFHVDANVTHSSSDEKVFNLSKAYAITNAASSFETSKQMWTSNSMMAHYALARNDVQKKIAQAFTKGNPVRPIRAGFMIALRLYNASRVPQSARYAATIAAATTMGKISRPLRKKMSDEAYYSAILRRFGYAFKWVDTQRPHPKVYYNIPVATPQQTLGFSVIPATGKVNVYFVDFTKPKNDPLHSFHLAKDLRIHSARDVEQNVTKLVPRLEMQYYPQTEEKVPSLFTFFKDSK